MEDNLGLGGTARLYTSSGGLERLRLLCFLDGVFWARDLNAGSSDIDQDLRSAVVRGGVKSSLDTVRDRP